jgi:hypothetical protein
MKITMVLRWLGALLLLAGSAMAQSPVVVHGRLTFQSTSNHWDQISTGAILNGQQGSLFSGFSFSASAVTNTHKFATNRVYRLDRPYTVLGVITNALDNSTQSLAIVIEIATAEKYLQGAFAATKGKLAFGFAYENNMTVEDFSNCDLIKWQNGVADAVVQYMTYDDVRWRPHTGNPSEVGTAVIMAASQTNVWITGKFDNAAGITNYTLAFYDWDARKLIGVTSLALSGASYPDIANLRIGNDTHSDYTATTTNYMNNLLLSTNVADFPILPYDTNEIWVTKLGNDSNSGYGSNAAQSKLTIQAAVNASFPGTTIRVFPGTYDEAVTISADATSNAWRKLVAYAGGSTGVVVRQFIVTGDYVSIQGFELTKIGTATNHTPIIVNDCRGVRILNNFIHNTGHGTSGGEGGGIRYGNLVDGIIRNNVLHDCGKEGSHTSPTHAKDIADYFGKTLSTNVVIEYNWLSQSSEYINPSGYSIIIRRNMAGPSDSDEWPDVHRDFVQPNAAFFMAWIEENWHVENAGTDDHLFLSQGNGNRVSLMGNVSVRSGDRLNMEYSTSTNLLAFHNTICETAVGPTRTVNSTTPWARTAATSGNVFGNNVFTNVTTAADPYGFLDGEVLYRGGDVMYTQGTPTSILAVTDPQFTDYTVYNLRPRNGSPLIDVGVRMTGTTTSGSSSTSVTVTNADHFHAGVGLVRGSMIYVGANNNLTVTGVDYTNHVITVSSPITWNAGDPVGRAYRGSGPDKGAYENGDTPLTAVNIATNGTQVELTAVGDMDFAIFYIDEVAQDPIYSGTAFVYNLNGTERSVRAEGYALRPQAQMVIPATVADAGEPATGVPATKRARLGVRMR